MEYHFSNLSHDNTQSTSQPQSVRQRLRQDDSFPTDLTRDNASIWLGGDGRCRCTLDTHVIENITGGALPNSHMSIYSLCLFFYLKTMRTCHFINFVLLL
jgi:hypothetical protein